MASTSIYIRDYRQEIPGELSIDRLTWEFPVIKSINAHNRITFWKIYVRLFKMDQSIILPTVPQESFIIIEDNYFDSHELDKNIYGWINIDSGIMNGKIKKSIPTIVKSGKNIGKISATNTWTQSLRDALGTYNKQYKKSASMEHKLTQVTIYPPMLAQIMKKNTIVPSDDNPIYIQRKYNGVRTITTLDFNSTPDGPETYKVIMYSRRRNLYPGFEYIKAELYKVLLYYWSHGRKIYLDGEIYKHGEALQNISGYARKENHQDSEYYYMIYDCFIPDEPGLKYHDRKRIIEDIFANNQFTYTKIVETYIAYSLSEIEQLYNQFIEEGYEGAMIRFNDAYKYSYNDYHSKSLLKMKPTLDAEFKIIGFSAAEKGKAAGSIMIICTTDKGKEFPVTPAMELADRLALEKKMHMRESNGKTHFENSWLGRMLIVYYDELSNDGVPQRARTKMEIRVWD